MAICLVQHAAAGIAVERKFRIDQVAMMMGKIGELAQTFTAAPPCVGFNCYFEIYCGFAINATLTALVFGGDA